MPEFAEAVSLLQDGNVSLQTATQYAIGGNTILSCAGLAALAKRADRAEALSDIVESLDTLGAWAMYFALQYLLALDPRPPMGVPLTGAEEWWRENAFMRSIFREYLNQRERLGDAPRFGSEVEAISTDQKAVTREFLERLKHPLAAALAENLDLHSRTSVDHAFLSSIGRFWNNEQDLDVLIEPDPWRETLVAVETSCLKTPMRSLLISGDPGVGKTSFLRLLAQRLELTGWGVFEASGADLQAGQLFVGQLEGRVRRTVEELGISKKLVWYIPDILQTALSGRHQGQSASILDQILPAITAGRLIVWTEASAASTSRLLRLYPVLRGSLELCRLEPVDQDEARKLAQNLADGLSQEFRLNIDPECIDVAVSSARQYLSASSLPGSVLDLLKLAAERAAKNASERLDPHDVIITLSQLTGLPASILDSKDRLYLSSIRAYFAARVIGQDEAVEAIVERIAMLKAGLNDPDKPIGVFLFAGPTGTGKTELAKTLSEFLFGSVDRMIRLDMSEFQTPETITRILGSSEVPAPTDSLISLVRKQPFSVVLLDEFEKAHTNIWDLFLQVFDDGRLTDQLGQVADFRHCIIILTSNLGASSRSSGLGFAPATPVFSEDQIIRAIGQAFRPEFQNRLDKVIVFHELNRDLMRSILKKELARVLERRGLKDREWAVEWEASAIEFLLEKGFSPELGARPLKRAIEQYVVAPLAAAIVEKRYPQGDQFVFVRSDGRAIQAEFVDPNNEAYNPTAAAEPPADKPLALPAMILAPSGTEAEVATLDAEFVGVKETIELEAWEELKATLSEEMLASDFWTRSDRHATLSRLALMDRVKAAAGTAQSLRTRLKRSSEQTGKSSRELIQRLALQLQLVKEGMKDVFEDAPIEVALLVEPTLEGKADKRAGEQWCSQLVDMYRAWAHKRHMQLSEYAGEETSGRSLLLINGFGAHRLLSQEVGLHVLELAGDDKSLSRVTARVRIATAPSAELPAERLRLVLKERLLRTHSSHAVVVRRYRSGPAPLVRDVRGGWRSGRLDAVLHGDFDLIAMDQN